MGALTCGVAVFTEMHANGFKLKLSANDLTIKIGLRFTQSFGFVIVRGS